MYAIKGYFDGKTIQPLEPIPVQEKTPVIIILETPDSFSDLIQGSQTTLDFWDNPIDDKIWNNA